MQCKESEKSEEGSIDDDLAGLVPSSNPVAAEPREVKKTPEIKYTSQRTIYRVGLLDSRNDRELDYRNKLCLRPIDHRCHFLEIDRLSFVVTQGAPNFDLPQKLNCNSQFTTNHSIDIELKACEKCLTLERFNG